ncbi:hypothetical protein DXD09_05665 [Ligilactobacillus ruminis]|uniref:Uncharacterized protein n=1 Tax=Ligilactobacillus ruminis TaxID=1623 RepID=A0A8B2Z7F9_9LACO|nr:hypothetical protein DXD09_05665 [Ligilactobacillus ruminis]
MKMLAIWNLITKTKKIKFKVRTLCPGFFLLGVIAKCRVDDSLWKMQGRCRSICADGLSVRGSRVLRADLKKRHFARKMEPVFTGRFEKTRIYP